MDILNLVYLYFFDNLAMHVKNLIKDIPWIHMNVVPITCCWKTIKYLRMSKLRSASADPSAR